MAKLRTRKHKVVLARSRGGDAGITFVLFLMMIGSNMAVTKLLSKVGQ